jgi:hypothetical protein
MSSQEQGEYTAKVVFGLISWFLLVFFLGAISCGLHTPLGEP